MPLSVTTNLSSINAQRTLNTSQRNIQTSFAQLASGNRINKASDDAAGLSISTNLGSQIRSYGQAKRNAQDAISMVQVAEGGLNEISNMLTRLRELGMQAASDSVGQKERGYINKEVSALKDEIERIAQTTRFGTTDLLNGQGQKFDFQVDIYNDDFKDRISFDPADMKATKSDLNIDSLDYTDKSNAQSALTTLDEAQNIVNSYRSSLGAVQNRLLSTDANLDTAVENLSAAKSRIADTDIAHATSELTRNNILLNASTSILMQANQNPTMALKLIG